MNREYTHTPVHLVSYRFRVPKRLHDRVGLQDLLLQRPSLGPAVARGHLSDVLEHQLRGFRLARAGLAADDDGLVGALREHPPVRLVRHL